MVHFGKEVKIRWLSRPEKHLDGFLRGSNGIIRRMNEQERARRNPPHHIIRAKVVHTAGHFPGEFRVCRGSQIVAQVRWDGHDIEPGYHQSLTTGRHGSTALEHGAE